MQLTRRRQRPSIRIREQHHVHLIPPVLLRGIRRHPLLHAKDLLLRWQHCPFRKGIRPGLARNRCPLVGKELCGGFAAFEAATTRMFADGMAPVEMLSVGFMSVSLVWQSIYCKKEMFEVLNFGDAVLRG